MTTLSVNVVVPTGIDFLNWTSTLFQDLPNLNIPLAESELKWKDWAQVMLLENELVNVPVPDNFTDWRNWAEYFLKNV